MKLHTTIPPRRDGKVLIRDAKGGVIEFSNDGAGNLSGDVTDEKLLAQLLASEDFFPADEADYDAAMAIVGHVVPVHGDQDSDDEDEGADEDVDVGEDDEGSMDAMPVEGAPPAEAGPEASAASPTPAKPAKPARAKRT